jgi:hypothetical protein
MGQFHAPLPLYRDRIMGCGYISCPAPMIENNHRACRPGYAYYLPVNEMLEFTIRGASKLRKDLRPLGKPPDKAGWTDPILH